MNFKLKKISEDFFVDFNCKKSVEKIFVNGKELPTENNYKEIQKDVHWYIPTENLQVGQNSVSILFSNDYSKQAKGFHSFIDADGTQYCYNLSEPYFGNMSIPCFDQPDLKGTFQLYLLVEQEWVAIFNEKVKQVAKELPEPMKNHFVLSDTEIVHTFNPTPRISTYLFVVIAGNYKEIPCPFKYKDIEFRLFCRQSLYKYAKDQSEEFFDITRACFEFYENFFGTPYPFSKYDQIFCPEYGTGAMETPGAVTFNDIYVFKDPPTAQLRYWVAHVIAHELAHMWFGNLVTMKWWNDLWLNESFADAMAYICLDHVKLKFPVDSPWLMFFMQKMRAYVADEKPTTHPISVEVKNTEMATLIFDAITYFKGGASLAQLYKLVGHDTLGKAMKAYFEKYAWQNAVLDQFIENLQKFIPPSDANSPYNLENWKKDWILTAGLTQIKAEWDPKNESPNAKLIIKQTSCLPEYQANKFIKAKVAFFDEKGQLLEVKDTILNKDTTEIEYDGSKRPKIVFPNYQDEAYAKVIIDQHSLAHLKNCVHLIQDRLTRAVIWFCFFEMVRDGEVTSLDFVEAAIKGLDVETTDVVITNLLEYISSSINNYTPLKLRGLLHYQIFEKLYRKILHTDPNEKNRLIILRRELIAHAHHEDHLEILRQLFEGKEKVLGEQSLRIIDQWNIVKKLYTSKVLTKEQKDQYFEKMKEKDPSDTAKSAKLYCDALGVSSEERKKLWDSFMDENNKESFKNIGEIMNGFNHPKYLEDLKPYHEQFWEVLFDVFDKRDGGFARMFFTGLYPCDDNLALQLSNIQKLVEKSPKNLESWKKCLKDQEFALQKRLKAYNLIGQSLQGSKL